jgi:hypothetical protein
MVFLREGWRSWKRERISGLSNVREGDYSDRLCSTTGHVTGYARSSTAAFVSIICHADNGKRFQEAFSMLLEANYLARGLLSEILGVLEFLGTLKGVLGILRELLGPSACS